MNYDRKKKDDVDYTVAKFMVEDYDYSRVTGDCYTCHSWYLDGTSCDDDFFAGIYCKWDGCTHWYFRGEKFDRELDNKDFADSYYHICGEYTFLGHIRTMCFVWKVVSDIMDGPYKDPIGKEHNLHVRDEFYFKLEKTRKLVEMMLDGYEIVRLED